MTRRRTAPAAVVSGLLALGGMAILGGCGSAAPTQPAVSAAASAGASSTAADPAPTTGSASGLQTVAGPPFVAAATWVQGSGGRSLHVVPTAAGRVTQGPGDATEAWREVLRLAPDADQPGMQAQFDCHWSYARLVQPDKASWNLEPWRPVVSERQLVDARCNPGGPESADG